MRKSTLSLVSLVLLVACNAASAYTVVLQAHNQRSSSGTLSTLVWKTCPPPTPPATYVAPCVNPNNSWDVANGVTGSNATWDWNPVTKVLTSTGRYETTSHLGSNPNGTSVIDDKTVDLVIDLQNDTTSATTYNCVEGNFLASVGANGCLNINLKDNFALDSTVLYNVGGNPNCVQRTVNPDDVSTGNPRGLFTAPASGGCDAVDGAYDLFTLLNDTTTTPGGTLRISNGIDIALPSTSYMTFVAVPDAVDDGPIQAPTGSPVSINVLANDNGFTNPVGVAVTTAPTKGTATVIGTSPGPQSGITIQYTANGGATGTDSFVYTVTDGNGTTTDSATVSINILAFGANDDSATTTLNHPTFNIPIGANDLGFTDPVTVTITVPPSNGGTAVPSAPGPTAGQVVAYTPIAALGTPTYTETFTYQMTDGVRTDTAVVTVTVVNNIPDAKDGGITISTAGVAPLNATGSFTAPGAGGSLGDGGTVTVTTQGTKGTAAVSGNVITYTITDASFFAGTDSFTYTITDTNGETDSGVVTVTVPAVTPTLANATITTTEGTASAPRALVFTPGNGSLAQHTFAVTTQGTGGSCALNGTSVTYTPNAGFSGSDSCVVTITDEGGAGQSDTGTISITVNASGGGGGGSGVSLPSAGALDPWSLSLLAGLPLLRRRRLLRGPGQTQGGSP